MNAVGRRSLVGAVLLSARSAFADLRRFVANRGGKPEATSAAVARERVSALLASDPSEDVIATATRPAESPADDTRNASQNATERLIVEALADVAVLHGPERAVLYVSPSVRKLLGIDAADFVLHDLIHPGDQATFAAAEASIRPDRPSSVAAFRLRHADGRWVWVEAVSDKVRLPGSTAPGILTSLRDITDRRNQTDELRMARDAAELAQARAESATRAKSEFIGLMSHEIRTPLTAIRGLIELLTENSSLDQQQRRHLSLVEASTETLLVAVDDILDYARSETGDLRIEDGRFSLATTIATVVEIVKPAALAKGLVLDVGLARELPGHVVGDARRLRQILLNLLNDAVGVARAGTVSLSVQGARLGQAAGTLRFAITAAIPDDRAPAHLLRTASLDGSGLGLAVAQRLVGLMGGRIDRATRPGEAAAYRFSLVMPTAHEVGAAQADQPAPTRAARVLVAEDNVVDQEIVRAMLERAGCVVDLVGDGQAALEAVQARTYDLVLMDMLMPHVDGLTAARRVRALQHPSRRVPIVAITADVMPHRIRAFAEAGINAYVAKPFTRKTLIDAVTTQLSAVVLLDTGEDPSRPARPAVFDRTCYDALRRDLGLEGAQAALGAFVTLVERSGDVTAEDAATISAAATRLGFLDLAKAYDRLSGAGEGPEAAAAQRRCRVARDLAQRTFGELTCLERPEVTQHQALL